MVFLRPFSKYKKTYMLYLKCKLKMMSMLNMKTLKHCENLFKVSNEIK